MLSKDVTKKVYFLLNTLLTGDISCETGDISCSLLLNPSHTDESWEGRNTCMWIYML